MREHREQPDEQRNHPSVSPASNPSDAQFLATRGRITAIASESRNEPLGVGEESPSPIPTPTPAKSKSDDDMISIDGALKAAEREERPEPATIDLAQRSTGFQTLRHKNQEKKSPCSQKRNSRARARHHTTSKIFRHYQIMISYQHDQT